MESLDKRIELLAKVIPKEIYEQGRGIDEALELVFMLEGDDLGVHLFNYDWSNRKRESEVPTLKGSFSLKGDQKTSLNGFYQNVVGALVGQGYFIEEKNEAIILLQPLATDWAYINTLVDNFIRHLHKSDSPSLERPRIGDSEQAYRQWLERYHKVNGIHLPRGFDKRNKPQLRGMFMGITQPAKLEQILSERQFVVEFYKAHGALLPEGFDGWGHKQINPLYEKLNRWYGNPAQAALFR